ncbi:MAG TPA: M20/M25/M40 family metallo-hydrolase [bacterium]|nr:M20/M25/M40 family metallo-hydrolase [bacterium]
METGARTDPAALVDEGQLVELTKGILRIPSPLGEERPLGEFVAAELERFGFAVELQEVTNGRANVIGIARGDPAYKSIMLNGHLDMNRPFGKWRRSPYDPWVEGGRLYGGMVTDMKGGLGSMIAAAAAVLQAAARPRGDLIVTAVMHHDTTGVGTKYFLESCPWRIDAAIVAEPTDLNLQTYHCGAWGFLITTRGIQKHLTRLEEGYVNAIDGMMRIVQRLGPQILTYERDPEHPFLPRMVWGYINGGAPERHKLTAETCTLQGDVRFLPSMSFDGIRRDFERLLAEVCAEMPGLSAKVQAATQQWPYRIGHDAEIVRTITDVQTRLLGRAPRLLEGMPLAAGVTDAADIMRHGIPAAIYGPGEFLQVADESVAVADLVAGARVMAAVCADITGRRR